VIDVQHRPCAPSNSTDFPSSSARFTSSAVSQMYSRIFSPSFSVSSTSCEKSMSAPYAPSPAVLFRHHVRRFLSKQLRLQQVAHAQPRRHFVFVGRANSTGGRANLFAPRAPSRLCPAPVIRKNQVRAIADVQAPLHVNPPWPCGEGGRRIFTPAHNAGTRPSRLRAVDANTADVRSQ